MNLHPPSTISTVAAGFVTQEKKDIKDLGLATGAYIAFATDAADFSDDDRPTLGN